VLAVTLIVKVIAELFYLFGVIRVFVALIGFLNDLKMLFIVAKRRLGSVDILVLFSLNIYHDAPRNLRI
jgi:hypothetical protein